MSQTGCADEPPAYDDLEGGASKTLDPAILVLSGQSIHAESADTAPLYQITRGVTNLTYATSEVELRRVDRVVATDDDGEPAVKPRSRHIYDLKHLKGLHGTLSSLPQDSPPIFAKAMSREALGDFALKKSVLRSHWRALPVDTTGKSSKYNWTAFAKDGKPLFEVRCKNGRYEWADAEGGGIAVEDGGEEQQRLLITACLKREVVDALVALWCCRLWRYSAESEVPLYSGVDSGEYSFRAALAFLVASFGGNCVADARVVRRKLALAKESPVGLAKSGAFL